MRWVTMVGFSFATLASPACTGGGVASPAPDGTLVLELGGTGPSLRRALSAAGVTPPPAKGLVPAGPGSGEAAPDPAAQDPVPPDPAKSLAAPPAPAPEPEPDYVVVKLARGQTLIHLAKRYLGDGNRFRELLTLNGWTEADARRLPENQPVRVPRALAPHAGRQ